MLRFLTYPHISTWPTFASNTEPEQRRCFGAVNWARGPKRREWKRWLFMTGLHVVPMASAVGLALGDSLGPCEVCQRTAGSTCGGICDGQQSSRAHPEHIDSWRTATLFSAATCDCGQPIPIPHPHVVSKVESAAGRAVSCIARRSAPSSGLTRTHCSTKAFQSCRLVGRMGNPDRTPLDAPCFHRFAKLTRDETKESKYLRPTITTLYLA